MSARLKTVWIRRDGAVENEVSFKYDINVTSDGVFTTMLPENIVKLLTAANIELGVNKRKRPGFFSDETCAGLEAKIEEVIDDYFSRTLVSQEVVIRYSIQTVCSYCISKEGEFVPNGAYEWIGSRDYKWREGNVDNTGVCGRSPYGLNIYVEPFMKSNYIYKSGSKKTEYLEMRSIDNIETYFKDKPNLKWLSDIVHMECSANENLINEVKYDEYVALFFVNFLKSLFKLNEEFSKFQYFKDPSLIREFGKKFNLLSGSTV